MQFCCCPVSVSKLNQSVLIARPISKVKLSKERSYFRRVLITVDGGNDFDNKCFCWSSLPRVVIDILQGKKVADGREVAVIGSLASLNFYYRTR